MGLMHRPAVRQTWSPSSTWLPAAYYPPPLSSQPEALPLHPPSLQVLLDGGVQLLDLVPQALGLILQGHPLLLQLADVLSRLLQGGSFADLQCAERPMKGRNNRSSPVGTACPQPPPLTLRLGWAFRVLTRLCRVSKPSLMLKRRFCSAEMWVMRRVSTCRRGQGAKH